MESQAVWDRQPCSVLTAQGWCAQCTGVGPDRSGWRRTHRRNPVSGLGVFGAILKAVGAPQEDFKKGEGVTPSECIFER